MKSEQVQDNEVIIPSIETITPQQAEEFLKGRHITRPLQQSRVAAYAGDMASGKWTLTHQGLAFDKQGRLIDGQHRSAACITANTPFRTMVFRHVPRKAIINTDTGAKRTAAHALTAKRGEYVSGSITTLMTNMLITDGLKAPGNLAFRGSTACTPPSAYEAFLRHYKDAIDFTTTELDRTKKAITVAPVRAAVAKAFMHTRKYPGGKKRLQEFCQVLYTGEPQDVHTDQAAIRLRNLLMENHDRSGSQRGNIYLKAAYCLDKFLKGERVNHVKAAEQDPFPLPKPATDFIPADKEISDRARLVISANAV